MSKQRTIEAAIFDLGGVIFGISLDPIIRSWAESSGIPPREIAEKFKIDSHHERFETGEISPEEFRAHVCDTIGAQLSPEDFDGGWNCIYLDVLPGIESILAEIRKDLRLVVLTNTNQIHARVWRSRYSDILTYFEKVFTSHEIGARKPEPEAFQAVLNYLDIEPGKVVFFDDNLENAQGANAVGINGFVVTSHLDVIEGLQQRGITVRS